MNAGFSGELASTDCPPESTTFDVAHNQLSFTSVLSYIFVINLLSYRYLYKYEKL